MKWFLLSVPVFLGSMVLFAAIPTSALIWARNVMVQPLEVFTDRTRPATDPTTGSAGPMHDGGNPPETRRRETIQADVAGRARVIDGDTIEVSSARIRLFGIDAPESAQRCLAGSRRWSCGEQATRALAGRIDGRSVACEERDRDRYGRIVAVCRHGGQDVNAWLVREGWAIAYRHTRRRTSARRRPRKRHSAECGEGNSFLRGIGAGAIAWIRQPGTLLASLHVTKGPAPSRGTSATTLGSASTTCPVIATTNALASAPRAVSGTSAPKPKRGRPAGGERVGNRTHCA